jgi:hypothetical protein
MRSKLEIRNWKIKIPKSRLENWDLKVGIPERNLSLSPSFLPQEFIDKVFLVPDGFSQPAAAGEIV